MLPGTAVIGVGKLGFFHAQKHLRAQKEGKVQFLGIFDVDVERAKYVQQELAKAPEYKGRIFDNLESLASCVQAVTIATKSSTHGSLTQFFLERGVHVLVEKPLALHLSEAKELLSLAQKKNLKLAVGHSERYQAVLPEVTNKLRHWQIRHVEMMRQTAFDPRVSDVSVVDDLMIHDLDLWFHLMSYQGDFVQWQVFGRKVCSDQWDDVEAIGLYRHALSEGIRVRFQASRVLPLGMRMCWIHADEGSLLIDWQKGAWAMEVYHTTQTNCPLASSEGLKPALRTWLEKEKQDHLWLETCDFLHSIQKTPHSSHATSPLRLAWAEQVLPSLKWRDQIHEQLNERTR